MTTENSLPDDESVSITEPMVPAGPTVTEAILESFIAKTVAAEVPAPWKFLAPSPLVRKRVTSLAELAEDLSSEFTIEDLQQSRLFHNGSGPPRLSRLRK